MDDPATGETKRVQLRQRGAHQDHLPHQHAPAAPLASAQRIERTKRAYAPSDVYAWAIQGASGPACKPGRGLPCLWITLVANSHAAEWLEAAPARYARPASSNTPKMHR